MKNLPKTRGEVYYNARCLVKNKRIQSAWTANGVILVEDNSNIVHRCKSMSQLVRVTFCSAVYIRHAPHRVYTDRLFVPETNTTSVYIDFTMYTYATILAFLKISLHNLIKHLTINQFPVVFCLFIAI